MGVEVLGPLSAASTYDGCFFINGIGSPANFWKKETIINRSGVSLERFTTLVHPTASVSSTARLGHGTVIFQNVTITSRVVVGHHVVVLPNSVLSHDSVVGDYSCLAGAVCVSGDVHIGRSCYLGAGSVVRNGTKLGDRSLVGMGSIVISDVDARTVVIGNPARVLRTIPDDA